MVDRITKQTIVIMKYCIERNMSMKKLYIVLVLMLMFVLLVSPVFGKDVIENQIDGNFEGFDEDNVFKLSNGQIWIQTEYKYHYHYAYMPKVIIFESNGKYYMKVDGVSGVVEVEQLR